MIDLRLGDCLEIMRGMETESVDAIITDLPYGTTACKWDVVIPFEPMWAQVKRTLKQRGVFVTTASQPFTTLLIASNLEWFKYCWVWDKKRATGGTSANKRPMRAHEDICVFGKSAGIYNPQMGTWSEDDKKRMRKHDFFVTKVTDMTHAPHVCYGRNKKVEIGRHPDSIIRIPAIGSIDPVREHPTQKPIALYEYLIRTYTNEGDTVLDFCMGSGSTGVACVQLGRDFIGCDNVAEYVEIAKRRIEAAQPVAIELPLMAEA